MADECMEVVISAHKRKKNYRSNLTSARWILLCAKYLSIFVKKQFFKIHHLSGRDGWIAKNDPPGIFILLSYIVAFISIFSFYSKFGLRFLHHQIMQHWQWICFFQTPSCTFTSNMVHHIYINSNQRFKCCNNGGNYLEQTDLLSIKSWFTDQMNQLRA